ncbi:GNAT family N-acyltransferase [Sulfitobacter sp. D35]|uniref:GNAT family N-acetyltransferase n=1 Tax=Sulfitobacter sp. D35 TaxID=3083252 RepID=UPI00296F532C|nr:GNAT family N-acyltransferase [Sulfitobacter sp. D35]MDW4496543.1 GNAT family N-acyltransferase [Sulfitobacter sp. D35]
MTGTALFPTEQYRVELARSAQDLEAAQRLRYAVFVDELGAGGPRVDHDRRLERDDWDDAADHLLLREPSGGEVVGVYRLLRWDRADAAGGYYSAGEYDLAPLLRSGRRLLELGRSCIRADHRGGPALFHLWSGLVAYIRAHRAEVLFGTASFHGTDVAALAGPLSLLYHRHLAPPDLRVRALPDVFQPMDLVAPETLDRRAAMRDVPPLIKAYLRLGGHVGEGAFVDRVFNTVDVCLVLDTARVNARQARIYGAHPE